MPETGSLRDRITTSTRCAVASLKASSFCTSENATPGLAGCVEPLELQLHVGAVVAGLEDARFSSSKSNSARDEIATTSWPSSEAAMLRSYVPPPEGTPKASAPPSRREGSEAGREQPVRSAAS